MRRDPSTSLPSELEFHRVNSRDNERPSAAGPVKSADRALALLWFVAEQGAVSFGEILEELGLARSSAHGLVQTMSHRGWLEHDSSTRRYSLGLRAWQVGHRYTGHHDLANLAKPIMDDLVDDLGETVQLARLDGVENVYIGISESRHPMRLASSVGMRLHAHATGLGKVLLAQLDPDDARSRLEAVTLPRLTERTICDVNELMAALDTVRRDGHSLDNEEYLEGCSCVAVPIRVTTPGLVAAMSVTAPTTRCGQYWPEQPLAALVDAAQRIERRLGG